MILFNVQLQLLDFDGKRMASAMQQQVLDAHVAAQKALVGTIVAHYKQGGMPVLSGHAKGSFQNLAEDLGLIVDDDAQPRIKERYAKLYLKKWDMGPQAEIIYESKTSKFVSWKLEVYVDHIAVNEESNPAPEWRWQKRPPWNFFTGEKKNQIFRDLRRRLREIYSVRNIGRFQTRALKVRTNRPAEVNAIIRWAREAQKPILEQGKLPRF